MTIIHTIPAYSDNYIWLFHQENSRKAYVVDPGDAAPVIATLEKYDLTLAGILITHHHFDHTGGVDALVTRYQPIIYGPQSEHFKQQNYTLTENDSIGVEGLTFTVLEIGGHTLDHIAYFATPNNEDPILFCGDTLFAGGCGRVFEGTMEQMHTSLQKLSKLPSNTKVFCAHEYTRSNIDFALAVEPNNTDLTERSTEVDKARAQLIPTVPSTLQLELSTNPFLRCETPEVIQSAEEFSQRTLGTAVDVFSAIREWKNNF